MTEEALVPQAPPTGASAAPWQRLDRRSIWVAPLRPLSGLLVTGLLVVTFRGWDRVGVLEPAIGAAVAVGAFVLSAWYWATTRYRVTPTHVEMRSGLLVRKHRSVARDRLRSVDLTADITHRLAGLTVVAIGTGRQGGDADDELNLDSVSAAEAEHLRAVLLARAASTRSAGAPAGGATIPSAGAVPSAPAEAAIATFQASWVRLAPLSLLGLVALGLVLAGAGQLLRTVGGGDVWRSGPARAVFDLVVSTPVLVTVLGGLVALVVLNTLLSTVLYVLFYGGYVLQRGDDGTLRISYGLLTRRSVSIEERRIRGVRLDEPLLLRLGGGARCKIVAAGLGVQGSDGGGGNEKQDGDLLLPNAPAGVAHHVMAAVLRTDRSPAAGPLRRHPGAALRVLLVRWLGAAVLPAVALAVVAAPGWLPHWPWQLALLLLVPAAGLAVLEHRNLGHARIGRFLVSRDGATTRHTVVVGCDGIIAWRFRRTVLQRRPRLLSATAAVAAGKGGRPIRYAGQDDILAAARDAVPGLLAPFLEPDERQT